MFDNFILIIYIYDNLILITDDWDLVIIQYEDDDDDDDDEYNSF